jgi:hypothetical protein
MRPGLTVVASILFMFICCAQKQVESDRHSLWYASGQKWGTWVPIEQYPFLSVRGACGDSVNVDNVLLFTLYTQIRNNSANAVAIVWAEPMFNRDTGKNIVSASFFERLAPGQITTGISSLQGRCGTTRTIYAKVECAAEAGNEESACFKDILGNRIAERTNQFRSRPK